MPHLIFIALCLLLLQAAPADAQAPSAEIDLLTPQLVEVEPGRRLHVACVGNGAPVVVFEQDQDGWVTDWKDVVDRISKRTTACVYERSGVGLSDPPRKPVTGINVTDDLRKLLRAQGYHQPVVLVGEGLGGFYATLFADRLPQHVAGLVLVDPAFAGDQPPLSPRQRRRAEQALSQKIKRLEACAEMARTDALDPQVCFAAPEGLSAQAMESLLERAKRASWYETRIDQLKNHVATGEPPDSLNWRQERMARRAFGEMPIVVLSPKDPSPGGGRARKAEAQASEHRRQGHQDLAARSSRGHWRETEGAGAAILQNHPDAVVAAIEEVITAAREGGKTP